MKYLPRKPKDRSNMSVYTIFNDTDFTNDHMLKLLTTQIALKARVRVDSSPN